MLKGKEDFTQLLKQGREINVNPEYSNAVGNLKPMVSEGEWGAGWGQWIVKRRH